MADHAKYPVEVLTPEGAVFNGDVEMLSTRTTTGEIGVLANHAPLMAILDPAVLRLHLGEGEVKRYAQGEGYLQVFDNHAMVLVEDAVPSEDLDIALLKDDLEEAEKEVDGSKEGTSERELAERKLRRVRAFLDFAEGTTGKQ